MKNVYIVLVNWNGWKDTIECLESVFRSDYPHYRVIVCDNGSTDGSVERIRDWAEGRLSADVAGAGSLRGLTTPPLSKPVVYAEYSRAEAESGAAPAAGDAPLVLIRTGANLGFAGGNNVGIRYAMRRGDPGYVWLLNNDTVIAPGALSALVKRMEEKPGAGMCGSAIFYYGAPDRIWALGGATFNKWIARPTHIGLDRGMDSAPSPEAVEREMEYVVGASMLVSVKFLEDVGLMSEDYFLCFEEIDWARRAGDRYSMAYAPDSLVYHKVSVSVGAFITSRKDGLYQVIHRRNRLLITRRYFPLHLPSLLLFMAYERTRSLLRPLKKLFAAGDAAK